MWENVTRDMAVEAHDWQMYWQSFVTGSAQRLQRFRKMDAPPFLVQKEMELLEKWTGNLSLAENNQWYPKQEEYPTFFVARLQCNCSLCKMQVN